MVSKEFKITSESGIHARPATLLVDLTNKFDSEIYLEYDDKKIDFKSIIGVLSLGIYKDSSIKLIFEGKDEQEASLAVSKLIKELNLAVEV